MESPSRFRSILAYAVPSVVLVFAIGAFIQAGISASLVIGAVFATGIFAILFRFPDACIPVGFWAMTFVPLLRRIVGGPDAYTPNDPLVFLPTLILIPLVLRRGIFVDRLLGLRSIYILLAVVASGTFVYGLASGGAAGSLILGTATLVVPLLGVLSVRPLQLKSVCLNLTKQGRMIGLVAATYGYVQFVAPFRWDLAWLESRREVISSFGNATAGEFRLFGPTSSPLSFALILSVCICCWLFVPRRGAAWPRLVAIAYVAGPLLLTSVRTSVFALLLAALLVGLFRRSGVAAFVLALTAAAYLALPALLGAIAPGLAGRYALNGLGSDISFVTRLSLLREALGRAVFSVGLGPGGSTSESTVIDNGYLASFLDLGLIGGAVMLGLAVAGLILALRSSVRRAQLEPQGAFAIIVIILVLAQSSAPVFQEEIGMFFWLGLLLLAEPLQDRYAVVSGTAELDHVPTKTGAMT